MNGKIVVAKTAANKKAGLKGQEPIIDDALFKEGEPDDSDWEIEKHKGKRCIIISCRSLNGRLPLR